MQRDGLQFKIRASCVEIYNESVCSRATSQLFFLSVATTKKSFDTASSHSFPTAALYPDYIYLYTSHQHLSMTIQLVVFLDIF